MCGYVPLKFSKFEPHNWMDIQVLPSLVPLAHDPMILADLGSELFLSAFPPGVDHGLPVVHYQVFSE